MTTYKTLLFSLLFFVFSLQMPAEAATLEVEWKDCLLSVRAEGVPLSGILESVSLKTGIEIVGSEHLGEPCTITFSQLHITEGLKMLLAKVNYIVIEERPQPEGEAVPSKVIISGRHGKGNNKEGKGEDYVSSTKFQGLETNTRLMKVQQSSGINSEEASSLLYEATKDPDPTIRELAYKTLHEGGDKKVADIITNDTKSRNIDVRRTAIGSIYGVLGSNALQVLREATEDSDTEVRQTAFQNLSKIDGGLGILQERLTHPDPEVRLMAMQAMESKGREYAYDAAMLNLHDSDDLVRSRAEEILQELGERKEVE